MEQSTKTFCPATQKQAVVTVSIYLNQRGRMRMGKPLSCNIAECRKQGTLKCLLKATAISI